MARIRIRVEMDVESETLDEANLLNEVAKEVNEYFSEHSSDGNVFITERENNDEFTTSDVSIDMIASGSAE